MAGFGSTVRGPLPARPGRVSGYFNAAGKPTFAKSAGVKSLLPTPTGGVSGYFSGSTPTFANSPEVKSLAQTPTGLPAKPPAAAGESPGTSATTTASSSQQPTLDATALGNIAANQFKVNNQINGLNQSSSNIGTNLQAALGQLAYQQPRQQLGLEQAANRQGSLYSTAYNQRLGDLNQNFLTRQNTATTSAGQRQGAIASQIQALLGGVPLYNQGQANASVARQIAAALANPATGQPAVQLTPQQVKYITAGMAKPSAPSRTIQSGGPWKAVASRPKAKAIQSGSWRRG